MASSRPSPPGGGPIEPRLDSSIDGWEAKEPLRSPQPKLCVCAAVRPRCDQDGGRSPPILVMDFRGSWTFPFRLRHYRRCSRVLPRAAALRPARRPRSVERADRAVSAVMELKVRRNLRVCIGDPLNGAIASVAVFTGFVPMRPAPTVARESSTERPS